MIFAEWRDQVRPWLAAGIKQPLWQSDARLGPADELTRKSPVGVLRLPAPLLRMLESIACFRVAGRYEFMYRLAWRTLYENRRLLEDAADSDVRTAVSMDSAIRRDCHKMHAFVRFREVADAQGDSLYVAWFEPEHEILRRTSGFFVDRYPNMNWTIATPDGTAIWSDKSLQIIDSPQRRVAVPADGHEDLWRSYYRSICNVARINQPAMQREMPQRYWRNLPEAAEIGVLLRDGAMLADKHQPSLSAAKPVPKAVKKSLADLPPPGEGPQECRRCELWKHATQAVVGEGPVQARIMLVGEQPGDEEDLRGHPFVGPAGKVLDQALLAAQLPRESLFITNAVKHFKWEPRGKRRLHKKPDVREINACNVWLEREITLVKPRVIVALGASALRALAGPLTIDAARSQHLTHASGARLLATYHPSAILRAEGERVDDLRNMLLEDLARARGLAAEEM